MHPFDSVNDTDIDFVFIVLTPAMIINKGITKLDLHQEKKPVQHQIDGLCPRHCEPLLLCCPIEVFGNQRIHHRHHEQGEQGTDTQADGDHQPDIVA